MRLFKTFQTERAILIRFESVNNKHLKKPFQSHSNVSSFHSDMGNIYPTLNSPATYDLNHNSTCKNSPALRGFLLLAFNRENKSLALNYFTLE